MKQSGGNIWVYSEPGQGTTFKVYFPRVEAAVDQPAAAPALETLKGSETILIAEDEPAVGELVRRVLARHGYRVLVASTPHEALDLAQRQTNPINLLISDVVLPEMSGRALASQLKSGRPNMRILFMSGYTDDAIVHHGVLDPDTPFLQKPFTPQALARKVRAILD